MSPAFQHTPTESPSPRGKSRIKNPSSFSSLFPSLSPPSAPIVDHPSSTSHLSSRAFTSWPYERQQSYVTCPIELYYSEGTLCLCARVLVHTSSPLSMEALRVGLNHTQTFVGCVLHMWPCAFLYNVSGLDIGV